VIGRYLTPFLDSLSADPIPAIGSPSTS
jgi:hypothetical protein